MSEPMELIVLTGGDETTPEDRMMTGAWRAATLDWLDRASQVREVGQVVVATNSAAFAGELRAHNEGVAVSVDAGAFHFGRRLHDIVMGLGLKRPFYVGAGSGVLLSLTEIRLLAKTARSGERLLVTNNFYSSDFVAWTPGDAIGEIDPPETDNDLAWRLGRQAGLKALSLAPSASTLFDLDTPVDLMIARIHPGTAPHLCAYLRDLDIATSPVSRALEVLRTPGASVLIAGRVGAAARAYLEQKTGCRVALFAEERGMRASGREERGEARSVLGHFMQERGPDALFQALAEAADLVLMDSRVLFSHFGKWPSAADRFRSDLMDYQRISDPMLRELTKAASQAAVPVVLGGHSLVSGGLYALVELAEMGRGD